MIGDFFELKNANFRAKKWKYEFASTKMAL